MVYYCFTRINECCRSAQLFLQSENDVNNESVKWLEQHRDGKLPNAEKGDPWTLQATMGCLKETIVVVRSQQVASHRVYQARIHPISSHFCIGLGQKLLDCLWNHRMEPPNLNTPSRLCGWGLWTADRSRAARSLPGGWERGIWWCPGICGGTLQISHENLHQKTVLPPAKWRMCSTIFWESCGGSSPKRCPTVPMVLGIVRGQPLESSNRSHHGLQLQEFMVVNHEYPRILLQSYGK